jgi:hypothetical protein
VLDEPRTECVVAELNGEGSHQPGRGARHIHSIGCMAKPGCLSTARVDKQLSCGQVSCQALRRVEMVADSGHSSQIPAITDRVGMVPRHSATV